MLLRFGILRSELAMSSGFPVAISSTELDGCRRGLERDQAGEAHGDVLIPPGRMLNK